MDSAICPRWLRETTGETMEFWRKKKAEGPTENLEAAARDHARSSTALTVRPIPEDALILIPLRNAVLFPGVVSPLTMGRAPSIAAAREAARKELKVGFVLQHDPQVNEVGPSDLYRVGTAGQIARLAAEEGGSYHLMVQGERRFRILEFLEGWPFLVASIAWITDPSVKSPEIEARFMQ